jgi:curli biogenesis system outer membrane secretion channel CsgG
MTTTKTAIKALLLGALVASLSACNQEPAGPVQLSLAALSNRPYLLSGGDALIEITASTSDSRDIRLLVNGIARSAALKQVGQDGDLTLFRTLVSGLVEGNNTVTNCR